MLILIVEYKFFVSEYLRGIREDDGHQLLATALEFLQNSDGPSDCIRKSISPTVIKIRSFVQAQKLYDTRP